MDDQNKLNLHKLAPEEHHTVVKAIEDKHIQLLNLRPSDNKVDPGELITELYILLSVPRQYQLSILMFQMDW